MFSLVVDIRDLSTETVAWSVKSRTQKQGAPKQILSTTETNNFDLDSVGRVPYIWTNLAEGVVKTAVACSSTFPSIARQEMQKTA